MQHSTIAVRECADMFLAQTLCNRLATEGIPSIVTGTDPVTALGFGGAGTNRLVRVEVAEKDYLRAAEILQADEWLRDTATAWVCSRCDEQNEPTFEVCWSCNKKRDGADLPGRTVSDFDRNEREKGWESETITVPNDRVVLPRSSNPYSPPVVIKTPSESSAASGRLIGTNAEQVETTKADVRRVFYSSIIGLLFFPPLLNGYSLYLTFGLSPIAYRIRSCRRQLLLATLINGINLSFWTFYWLTGW
ncbi:hypothetical protein Q31b_27610 [Novipirellula aureliae]|uniref:RanBP2-type domain-containing protein n=1 Tax=Novipirellula aureliae TaxID=2527966 RepID=A0A5C6DXG3_9BACT|nr:DUF2007 domain-containing protein [Novipirellula aureliae]TWU41322.1 hypothetical protein Q31b_27610 [Novipirellula aureliae]